MSFEDQILAPRGLPAARRSRRAPSRGQSPSAGAVNLSPRFLAPNLGVAGLGCPRGGCSPRRTGRVPASPTHKPTSCPFSLSPRQARSGQTRGRVAGPKDGSWRVPGSVPLGGSVRDVGSAQRSPGRQVPHAGKALRGGEGPGRFPLLLHDRKRGVTECLLPCCSGSDPCERVMRPRVCVPAACRPPRGLARPSVGACRSALSEQTRWAVPAYPFLPLCLPFFGFDSFRCPGGALACC